MFLDHTCKWLAGCAQINCFFCHSIWSLFPSQISHEMIEHKISMHSSHYTRHLGSAYLSRWNLGRKKKKDRVKLFSRKNLPQWKISAFYFPAPISINQKRIKLFRCKFSTYPLSTNLTKVWMEGFTKKGRMVISTQLDGQILVSKFIY